MELLTTPEELAPPSPPSPRAPVGAWFSRRPGLVKLVAVLALLAGAAYLTWRVAASWRGANPLTYPVLLAAEVLGYLSLATFAFLAWEVPPWRRRALGRHPSVDVFVCTYDEGPEVLRPTLVGCRAMRRPHTTWVLDDGRRPWVREMAERLGARYLTREGNAHAKAGNINAALPRTSGELILVLDADHVPMPDLLDATLPYFEDPAVALVQTPHDFFNHDSIQHYETGRHEQSSFYEVVLPGKDRHNAAFWCGSAGIIRRAALEEVGGVATETIAEDFHTTLKLHSRGWRTRYHGEVVVQGLAPHDLPAYLLQRDRWARGNLSTFRTPENPLRCPGLTLKQRLSYTASLLSYFMALQRLALVAVLVATLVTGTLPLRGELWQLLALWLPWSVLAALASVALARGCMSLADSSHYGWLTAGVFTRAARAAVSRVHTPFEVTPKEGVDRGGLAALAGLRVVVACAVLVVAGVLVRLLDVAGVVDIGHLPALALWATLALAAWELVFLLRTTRAVAGRHQLRRRFRFPTRLPARLGADVVRVVDLTPEGAGLASPRALEVGSRVRLRVALPRLDGAPAPLELPGVVRSSDDLGGGLHRVGVAFDHLDDGRADQLAEYCYVVLTYARVRGIDVHLPPAADDAELGDPGLGSGGLRRTS